MHALVKVPGLSQDLTWLTNWCVVHLLAEDFLGSTLYIQWCDDTLSWAILALVGAYLLCMWCFPCLVIFYFSPLYFVARKATGSAVLQSSILIWCAVSVLLNTILGAWSYFLILHFVSGY